MARHLLVTNDFPPKTGGIQVYLYELWCRLEPGRAAVLTASSHPDAAAFDATSGVTTERVRAKTLYLPTWRAYREIEAAIARHDPELVLLDPAFPLGLLGPFLSRPYGVVLHGAEVTIPARLPFVGSMLRFILRRSTVALAAGKYPEAEARRNCPDDMPPVVQVPPGVDTERFQPSSASRRQAVRDALGVAPDARVVLSYSRLVPRKGMDTLLRAVALLQLNFPDLHLFIGGEGRDRARLEKLAAKHRVAVTFLGRIPDESLNDLLGASDVMVMDCRSRWLGLEQEGFGIVFLEAAAAGVPQVAGKSGGSHEAVIDGVTGTVVANPLSGTELAKAIGELLYDEQTRAAYAHRSRVMATESFQWEQLAHRLSADLAPYDHAKISEPLL